MLDAQEDIKSQVQEELGDRQREIYLREQLKTIRRELGDEDEATEVDELELRLEALDLPEEARKEVDRELGRLRRIGRESMESQVIRTYLEHVAELPWNERTEEHLDLAEASQILDDDHYALGDVKDRVLEFLAVRAMRAKRDAAPARARSDATSATGAPTPVDAEAAAVALGDGAAVTTRRPPSARRSCSSSALRASARPRWPRASPARWGGSTSASRSAARATRPTSAATAAPTSARCRAASSRG